MTKLDNQCSLFSYFIESIPDIVLSPKWCIIEWAMMEVWQLCDGLEWYYNLIAKRFPWFAIYCRVILHFASNYIFSYYSLITVIQCQHVFLLLVSISTFSVTSVFTKLRTWLRCYTYNHTIVLNNFKNHILLLQYIYRVKSISRILFIRSHS